jgi:hypothetical protein
MLHKHNLEALDNFLKELMNCTRLFGGILLLISGDFRQILPVIRHGRRPVIVQATIK